MTVRTRQMKVFMEDSLSRDLDQAARSIADRRYRARFCMTVNLRPRLVTSFPHFTPPTGVSLQILQDQTKIRLDFRAQDTLRIERTIQ